MTHSKHLRFQIAQDIEMATSSVELSLYRKYFTKIKENETIMIEYLA